MVKTVLFLLAILLIIALIWVIPALRAARRSRLKNQPFPRHWVTILERNIPIYKRLTESLSRRLHGHINVFLAEKQFIGCGGLRLTDEIKGSTSRKCGNGMMTKKNSSSLSMECPLCGHHKTHKHGKTSKGSQGYYCLNCQQSFTETFDTIYYRRQVEPEKIRLVLQAHSEGSSLRGVSRTTKLAYNTVVSLVRRASVKGQMVHNERVQQIETEEIAGDEFWSFVQKNKKTAFKTS